MHSYEKLYFNRKKNLLHKHRSDKTDSGNTGEAVLVEFPEPSTSRSSRCSRRSASHAKRKNQESKTTLANAESESASSEDRPLVSGKSNLETVSLKGVTRKRSYPNPAPLDHSQFSGDNKSKRSKQSLDIADLRSYTDEEGSVSGIRAALRSNPQAALFSGLSPRRRRSSSQRISTGSGSEIPSAPAELEQDRGVGGTSATISSSEATESGASGKGGASKAKQRGEAKKDRKKAIKTSGEQQIQPTGCSRAKPYTKKQPAAVQLLAGGSSEATAPGVSSSGNPQQHLQQQKSQKGKKNSQPEPGVASRSKSSKTTGSCASNR